LGWNYSPGKQCLSNGELLEKALAKGAL
jgi:hypothetical protein